MDEKYASEFTKDWELLCKEGSVEGWKYTDLVDWKVNHCIKVDGKVKAVLDEDLNPYTAFELAKQLLS
ncbi:hypothetical protein QTG56_24240 (plasmid) [Rossellomorea sp. AcN35-11]|nr:hypothetical protein [Rossellomorea aquimaris]WJV31750.1 hypothetical protein QTG56_24240 [Rossellomorea sp. AcN35-11]